MVESLDLLSVPNFFLVACDMQVFSFALISDLCPLEMRSPVTTPSVRPAQYMSDP